MTLNRVMVYSGVATLVQAASQLIFTALGLAQHFCVVDFLRGLPLLLYVKILYFHNPDSCGLRINIGQAIDGIADQAFVLLTREPFTAFRTFIINATSVGLSILWIIASVVIIMGGARDQQSKGRRWPWIIVTVAVCGVDLVATVTYANDSFHTRTLNEIMDFIGGIASGTANVELNTAWAAWLMVILYSKFVLFFLVNVMLIIVVIVDCNVKRDDGNTTLQGVENPAPVLPPPIVPPTVVEQPPVPIQETAPIPAPAPIQPTTHLHPSTPAPIETNSTTQPPPPIAPVPLTTTSSERDEDISSLPSEAKVATRIPRAEFRRSFRRMKAFLFKSPSPMRARSIPESLEASPERRLPRPRSPRTARVEEDKKRTVNFPESLLSLPQRLENIIAEQQRRLDSAVIDTSGRRSPPRASQSMPQLATTHDGARGRRGTTAELQGQLPWAYIPAPAHRMRDQLPPDEDLPPVPLPDYTAFPSGRKASVHRAASSLSSLQKKDYATRSSRPNLNQADVLY